MISLHKLSINEWNKGHFSFTLWRIGKHPKGGGAQKMGISLSKISRQFSVVSYQLICQLLFTRISRSHTRSWKAMLLLDIIEQEQKLLNTSASKNKCVKNSQNSQTGQTGQTVKNSQNSKKMSKIVKSSQNSKQDQGSKAPSGRSSFDPCLPFYQSYLSIISFAQSTFITYLPFCQSYLSILSIAPSTFIPYLPFYQSYLSIL